MTMVTKHGHMFMAYSKGMTEHGHMFYLPLPCPLVRTAEEVMHFFGQHGNSTSCTTLLS